MEKWKCDVCGCLNDEYGTQCFNCGCERCRETGRPTASAAAKPGKALNIILNVLTVLALCLVLLFLLDGI